MRNSILAQVLDQSARARCKFALVFIFNPVEGNHQAPVSEV